MAEVGDNQLAEGLLVVCIRRQGAAEAAAGGKAQASDEIARHHGCVVLGGKEGVRCRPWRRVGDVDVNAEAIVIDARHCAVMHPVPEGGGALGVAAEGRVETQVTQLVRRYLLVLVQADGLGRQAGAERQPAQLAGAAAIAVLGQLGDDDAAQAVARVYVLEAEIVLLESKGQFFLRHQVIRLGGHCRGVIGTLDGDGQGGVGGHGAIGQAVGHLVLVVGAGIPALVLGQGLVEVVRIRVHEEPEAAVGEHLHTALPGPAQGVADALPGPAVVSGRHLGQVVGDGVAQAQGSAEGIVGDGQVRLVEFRVQVGPGVQAGLALGRIPADDSAEVAAAQLGDQLVGGAGDGEGGAAGILGDGDGIIGGDGRQVGAGSEDADAQAGRRAAGVAVTQGVADEGIATAQAGFRGEHQLAGIQLRPGDPGIGRDRLAIQHQGAGAARARAGQGRQTGDGDGVQFVTLVQILEAEEDRRQGAAATLVHSQIAGQAGHCWGVIGADHGDLQAGGQVGLHQVAVIQEGAAQVEGVSADSAKRQGLGVRVGVVQGV